MAITRRPLIVLLAQLLLSCATLVANNTPASETPVSVEFTVFAQERLQGVYYRPQRNAGLERLESYTQIRSGVYAYRGPRELRFYGEPRAGATAAEEAEAPVVAIAMLPEGAGKVLVLFTPLAAPDAAGCRFAVKVIDDSLGASPLGQVTILNAAGCDYAVDIAGRRRQVSSGAVEYLSVRGRTRLRFATQFKGRWHRAGSHELDVPANARACVVLFPPPTPSTLSPQLRVLLEEFDPVDAGRARRN